jgi:nuclear pore complex protein Nup62
MDEILTRWATDLNKYQKEFQHQAKQVAAWDQILVENTEKIGKLVTKTFQAERDAAEVEKQLSNVEGQQNELEQWLDKYDKEVDEMVQKVGLSGDGGGIDLERERTCVLFKPVVCFGTYVLQVQACREAHGPT